jgi:hypothetical protein
VQKKNHDIHRINNILVKFKEHHDIDQAKEHHIYRSSCIWVEFKEHHDIKSKSSGIWVECKEHHEYMDQFLAIYILAFTSCVSFYSFISFNSW